MTPSAAAPLKRTAQRIFSLPAMIASCSGIFQRIKTRRIRIFILIYPPGGLKAGGAAGKIIRNERMWSHAYGRCIGRPGSRGDDVRRLRHHSRHLPAHPAQRRKHGGEAADDGSHVRPSLCRADDQLHHPRDRLLRPPVRRDAALGSAGASGGLSLHGRDPSDPMPALCRRGAARPGGEHLEYGLLRLLCGVLPDLPPPPAQPPGQDALEAGAGLYPGAVSSPCSWARFLLCWRRLCPASRSCPLARFWR